MVANMPLKAALQKKPSGPSEAIVIGNECYPNSLQISFKRTVRVPDNIETSDLPPGLGAFPLHSVSAYQKSAPKEMVDQGGVFFPMYQREAMWINFNAHSPFLIKTYVGGINAVSGEPASETMATTFRRAEALRKDSSSVQDYIAVPQQYWLDGIAVEPGKVRQFIAMPSGSGYSVEAQVTGKDAVRGIRFEVTPRKTFCTRISTRSTGKATIFVKTLTGKTITVHCDLGITVDDVKHKIQTLEGIPPDQQRIIHDGMELSSQEILRDCTVQHGATLSLVLRLRGGGTGTPTMAVAAGGFIRQRVQCDNCNVEGWSPDSTISFNVHILNSEVFRSVTGKAPPPTPVSMKEYQKMGLPFFDFKEPDSIVSGNFKSVSSVNQIDQKRVKDENQLNGREAIVAKPPTVPIEHFLYHVSINTNGTIRPFRTITDLEAQIRKKNGANFG